MWEYAVPIPVSYTHLLMEGQRNVMIGIRNNEIVYVPFVQAIKKDIFQSPLTAILRGLGYVKDMSKIGFYGQIINPLCIWLGRCV